MLYLAQAKKNLTSGATELQLLAYQESEQIWEISNSDIIPIGGENCPNEGLLVLVEIGDRQEILEIRNAKDWVISLIQQYLSCSSITPEFVQQEQTRIEQWRQEITAQSLDLTRRYLEVETQREQLQELETSLKLEKEQLEIRWKQLHELESFIEPDRNEPSV
jgi:DNA repair exonuclease SbcCD ATPase subunit